MPYQRRERFQTFSLVVKLEERQKNALFVSFASDRWSF